MWAFAKLIGFLFVSVTVQSLFDAHAGVQFKEVLEVVRHSSVVSETLFFRNVSTERRR
jgi:hypothetical protein